MAVPKQRPLRRAARGARAAHNRPLVTDWDIPPHNSFTPPPESLFFAANPHHLVPIEQPWRIFWLARTPWPPLCGSRKPRWRTRTRRRARASKARSGQPVSGCSPTPIPYYSLLCAGSVVLGGGARIRARGGGFGVGCVGRGGGGSGHGESWGNQGKSQILFIF